MARLPLLLMVVVIAVAGVVSAAPARDANPGASAAAKKLTKKQRKAKKKCLAKGYRYVYVAVKKKKGGKTVTTYKCHRRTDAELAELGGDGSDAGDDDGEGDLPPVVLPSS
jgi:hypothetical protein